MASDDNELSPELLDDFFAECDEQLADFRTQLALLERALDAGTSDTAALERLYRGVHSFKGNAAIVGLAPAEELAHAAEGLLRGATRDEFALDDARLDLIARTGQRLEQCVEAFRHRQAAPRDPELLAALGPYQTAPAASARDAANVGSAPESLPSPAPDATDSCWHAGFTPSPELDQRGVNVTSIRRRLSACGEIVSATPVVETGGGIRFDFAVRLAGEPPTASDWAGDGVLWRVPASGSGPAESVPAVASPAAAPAESPATAPSHVVRVDLARLDELMRIAGELVIQRSRLHDRIGRLAGERAALQEVDLALARSLRDLRAALMRVRLVPVHEIFSRVPYLIRDLNRDTGKRVRLVLEGQDTKIDKYIVERLREPLLHLVRNAVSHGVEPAGERREAGKPEEAVLLLRASTVGDSVQILIRDDGRGVDAAKIGARAAAAGLAVPAELDDAAVLDLLCTSGFSTRDEADLTAGRGVGMSVVASTVRELGGRLSLATRPGEFTQFTLRLPLTLAIADTFVVSAGDQSCAIPQGFVEEIVQVDTSAVRTINHAEVIPYRGALLPLQRLGALFGGRPVESPVLSVLVLANDGRATGLAVDKIHGQREVVVRPLQDPLVRVPGVTGATELGDGKPVLVLDVATLGTALARRRRAESSAAPASR